MKKFLFISATAILTGVGLASVGLGVSDVGFWCALFLVALFNGAISGLSK